MPYSMFGTLPHKLRIEPNSCISFAWRVLQAQCSSDESKKVLNIMEVRDDDDHDDDDHDDDGNSNMTIMILNFRPRIKLA